MFGNTLENKEVSDNGLSGDEKEAMKTIDNSEDTTNLGNKAREELEITIPEGVYYGNLFKKVSVTPGDKLSINNGAFNIEHTKNIDKLTIDAFSNEGIKLTQDLINKFKEFIQISSSTFDKLIFLGIDPATDLINGEITDSVYKKLVADKAYEKKEFKHLGVKGGYDLNQMIDGAKNFFNQHLTKAFENKGIKTQGDYKWDSASKLIKNIATRIDSTEKKTEREATYEDLTKNGFDINTGFETGDSKLSDSVKNAIKKIYNDPNTPKEFKESHITIDAVSDNSTNNATYTFSEYKNNPNIKQIMVGDIPLKEYTNEDGLTINDDGFIMNGNGGLSFQRSLRTAYSFTNPEIGHTGTITINEPKVGTERSFGIKYDKPKESTPQLNPTENIIASR